MATNPRLVFSTEPLRTATYKPKRNEPFDDAVYHERQFSWVLLGFVRDIPEPEETGKQLLPRDHLSDQLTTASVQKFLSAAPCAIPVEVGQRDWLLLKESYRYKPIRGRERGAIGSFLSFLWDGVSWQPGYPLVFFTEHVLRAEGRLIVDDT